MAFTTWTALKNQMLDDLASGNWRHVSEYSFSSGPSSRSFKFRALEEFMKLLREVEARAAEETADSACTSYEMIPTRSGRWS